MELQNQDIIVTNYFSYHGKSFGFNVDWMKYYSRRIMNNLSLYQQNTTINLIDVTDKKNDKLLDDSILNFIRFCQREKVSITINNVLDLLYLSKIYDVSALKSFANEFIQQHHQEMLLKILTYIDIFQDYGTTEYENMLSSNLLDYIDDDQLYSLPIEKMVRIFNNFVTNNYQEDREDDISKFLERCIRVYKRPASILFTNIDMSRFNLCFFERVIQSPDFDPKYINPLSLINCYKLLKGTCDKQKEITKFQNDLENRTMEQISKIDAEKDALVRKNEELREDMISLKDNIILEKDAFQQNYRDFQHKQDENLAKIEIQFQQLVSVASNNSIKNFNMLDGSSQLYLIKEMITRENTENVNKYELFLTYISKEVCRSSQNLGYLSYVFMPYEYHEENCLREQFNSKTNNIGIHWYITDILYLLGSISSENFTNLIKLFSTFCIEIRYPSSNFNELYQLIVNIKSAHKNTVKISLFIGGMNETDITFEGNNDIDMLRIDSSCVNIKGEIDIGSFSRCTVLTKVILPTSVISLDDNAFCNCQSLKTIIIPSSVTKIGSNCFSKCTSLTEIVIPSSVLSLGEQSFFGCTALTKLILSSSLVSIGSRCFSQCTALTMISIPPSVKNIGCKAFLGCNALKQVILSSSLLTIDKSTFEGCVSLSSITIPNSVQNIKSKAFYGCSSLTQLIIPSSVRSIEEQSLWYCASLQNVYISSSILHSSIFNAETFNSLNAKFQEILIAKMIEEDNHIHLKVIADFMSYILSKLTQLNLQINDNIFFIPDANNNNYLSNEIKQENKKLGIRNNVIEILKMNNMINSGDFKNQVNQFNQFYFEIRYSLTSTPSFDGIYQDILTLKNSAQDKFKIGIFISDIDQTDEKFKNNTSISFVRIDSNVNKIIANSFQNCSILSSVEIPPFVNSIGNYAFDNCGSLTNIVIPPSVTSIGCYSFRDCALLKNITIPTCSIGIGCFWGSTSLNSSCISSISFFNALGGNIQNKWINDIGIKNGCSNELYNLLNFLVLKNQEFSNKPQNSPFVFIPRNKYQSDDLFNWIKNESKTIGISSIAMEILFTNNLLNSPKLIELLTSFTEVYMEIKYPSSTLNFDNLFSAAMQLKTELPGKIKIGIAIIGQATTDQKFKNNQSISFLNIDCSTTTIGSASFQTCQSLEYVTMPISVTSIADCAFENCEALTIIDMPSSLTTIGNYVFKNCKQLIDIVIPESVKAIGHCAFEQCSRLQNIDIPSSVTTIGNYAFHQCSSLKKIEIPSSVTSIGSYIFQECVNLTDIKLSNNITVINSCSFHKCFKLQKIVVPLSVTTINDRCFQDCSSLEYVEIPSSISSINNYCFYGCKSLHQVEIPYYNQNSTIFACGGINSEFFNSIEGKAQEFILQRNSDDHYKKMYNLVLFISDINQKSKIKISNNNFIFNVKETSNETNLDREIINGMRKIGISTATTELLYYNDALSSHYFLSHIPNFYEFNIEVKYSSLSTPNFDNMLEIVSELKQSFPDIVKIGILIAGISSTDTKLRNNTNINYIKLDSSVKCIADYSFQGCSGLEKVYFPLLTKLNSIGLKSFQQCTSLRSIVIPSTVTSISDYAFDGCTSLHDIQLPLYISKISNYMFSGCTSLEHVRIPDYVCSIGDFAFYCCSFLVEVIIPSSVKSIGTSTFNGCSSILQISFPSSVTSIGSYTFDGCSSLKQLSLPTMLCRSLSPNTAFHYSIFNEFDANKQISIIDQLLRNDNHQQIQYIKDLLSYLNRYNQNSTFKVSDMGFLFIPDTYNKSNTFIEEIKNGSNMIGLTAQTTEMLFRNDLINTSEFLNHIKPFSQIYFEIQYSDSENPDFDKIFTQVNDLNSSNPNKIKIGVFIKGVGKTNQKFKGNNIIDFVRIGSSVTSIGPSFFMQCYSLRYVSISPSVKSICDNAFHQCYSLSTIIIPSSVDTIETRAFYSCKSLAHAIIPSSITMLGSNVFELCSSLRRISILPLLTSIPPYTFSNCTNLHDVIIPSTVTSIRDYAFVSCTSMRELDIPPSITQFCQFCFYNCISLSKMTFSQSVIDFQRSSLASCQKLKQIIVNSSSSFQENSVPHTTVKRI